MTGCATANRPLGMVPTPRFVQSVAAAALLAVSPLALAEETGPIVTGGLGKKLDRYLSRLEACGFSGGATVVRDGDVLLAKGYGLADREKNRPCTTETIYDIGSITKQFTAAAIMKLQQQGKLSVSDPVSKHLGPMREDKSGITLHHLLTHTAGLIDGLGGDYDPLATRDAVLKGADASTLLWPPGTKYQYSNLGYSLLGMVVEKASGKPYEQFLQDELFKPAGMIHTGYMLPDYKGRDFAVGYLGEERWGIGAKKTMLSDGPCWNLRCNGGIHTTLADMQRWHAALLSDAVLSAESKKQVFAPQADEGGGQSYYGYGWSVVQTPRGGKLVEHNGGNGIFSAVYRRFLDDGIMIFVATNQSEWRPADFVADGLAAIVFNEPHPMPPELFPLDDAALDRLGGEYAAAGGAIRLARNGRTLRMTPLSPIMADVARAGSAKASPDDEALTQTMVKILDEARQDKFDALQTSWGGKPDRIERLKRVWRDELAAMSGYDVRGASADADGARKTTAIIQRPAEPVRVEFIWSGGRLQGVRLLPAGGPGAESFTLVPVAAGKFAPFSLRPDRQAATTFEIADDSGGIALLIRGPAGETRLTRK